MKLASYLSQYWKELKALWPCTIPCLISHISSLTSCRFFSAMSCCRRCLSHSSWRCRSISFLAASRACSEQRVVIATIHNADWHGMMWDTYLEGFAPLFLSLSLHLALALHHPLLLQLLLPLLLSSIEPENTAWSAGQPRVSVRRVSQSQCSQPRAPFSQYLITLPQSAHNGWIE